VTIHYERSIFTGVFSLVALTLWLVTAALGILELLAWRSASNKPPPLAYRHAATALAGLAVWAAFVITDRALLAWAALAVLALNNGLGDLLTTRGWRSRNSGGTASLTKDVGSAVGEVLRFRRSRRVIAHALLAGVTFLSVLAAAVVA
jgi:hypothetical protein